LNVEKSGGYFMNPKNIYHISLMLIIFTLAACRPASITPLVENLPTAVVATSTQSPPINASAVRTCDYIPGESIPAQMPVEVLGASAPTPAPTPFSFTQAAVDASSTSAQLGVFQQIWDDIDQNYVYTDFNGKDWEAIGQKYQEIIKAGLEQEEYYLLMKQMLSELGDGVTKVDSPTEVAAQNDASTSISGFVGIGGIIYTFEEAGHLKVILIGIYSGSPAEKAGLKPHDALLMVDGGPVLDENNMPRSLGEEGTSVTLTVQTPNQPPRDVSMVRQKITSQVPVDACLVSGTRIGYIHWLDFDTLDLGYQVSEVLKRLGEAGPLQGLVIDTRGNTSGYYETILSVLSLFTKGTLGNFYSREGLESYTIQTPLDVSGSQTIPLVLLQDETSGTTSFIFNGLLQLNDRAQIVGMRNAGPMYDVVITDLSDHSRLYVPRKVFQPEGEPPGYFNVNGILPDYTVPARFDVYTEATDPLLAKAIEVIQGK
jgi:carboxyl-terminal processing protease